jgi:hypothetical protein
VAAEEGMVRKEYIEEGAEKDVNEEGGVMKRNGVGGCKLGGGALGLGTSEPGTRFGKSEWQLWWRLYCCVGGCNGVVGYRKMWSV